MTKLSRLRSSTENNRTGKTLSKSIHKTAWQPTSNPHIALSKTWSGLTPAASLTHYSIDRKLFIIPSFQIEPNYFKYILSNQPMQNGLCRVFQA